MTITALIKHRRSFVRPKRRSENPPDLFCNRKYIVAPTFEASVQRVFKDKTPKKVKRQKDPKRVEAAHKGRKKYVNKLKESILNDVEKGSGDTTNASNEATSANNNASNENASATARSNHTYIYGVGILAVLAIGVCVFFAYNTFSKNKKIINEKQDQQPKRLRVFKKPL